MIGSTVNDTKLYRGRVSISRPPFPGRLIAAGAVLVTTVISLSGCTGGSSPASSAADHSATATVTAVTRAESTSPPTGAAAAVLTTSVGGQTTVVTLAPTDGPLGPAASTASAAGDAALEHVMPGLYGLDSLGATVEGANITLMSAAGCDLARDIVNAGQWSLTPVLQPHDSTVVYVDVLTRGAQHALLYLKESPGMCTGRISVETSEELQLAGAISAAGPARAVTVSCMPLMTDDGSNPAHSVVMSYRTDDAALAIMVTVPDALGAHPVDEDDAFGLIEFDPAQPALAQAATMAAAYFDPSKVSSDAFLPGVDESQAWFGSDGASVTVTSTDPLAGTVDAPNVVRVSDESVASFSAGFHC